PALRPRRVVDQHRAGGGVPHHHVGAGPAVAGARIAAVADVDLVAGGDVVEQAAGRPAVVGAGVGVGHGGLAVEEHVGPGDVRALDEVVAALDGEAALEQHHLAVVGVERVATPAGDHRDGIEAGGVLHGHPLRVVVDVDRRVAVVDGGDVADPPVHHALEEDEVPAVHLVGGAGVLAVAAQVLDAHLRDAPGRRVLVDRSAPEDLLERIDDGRVDGDGVAGNGGDDAIELQVLRAGRPGVVEAGGPVDVRGVVAGPHGAAGVHAQEIDPLLGRGPVHHHGVARLEARGVVDVEGASAHRHVLIGDRPAAAGHLGEAPRALDQHQRALDGTGRDQHRAVGPLPLAAQDHAALVDGDDAGD